MLCLREGRKPSNDDSVAVLPVLLELWDIGNETVTGAWLYYRNVNIDLLTELGFLVPAGWIGDDLVDEDDLGLVAMDVRPRLESPKSSTTEDDETPEKPKKEWLLA